MSVQCIPGSPGVYLGPTEYHRPGGRDNLPRYRAPVNIVTSWLLVMTSLISQIHYVPARHSHTPIRDTAMRSAGIGLRFTCEFDLKLSLCSEDENAAASNGRRSRGVYGICSDGKGRHDHGLEWHTKVRGDCNMQIRPCCHASKGELFMKLSVGANRLTRRYFLRI